MDLQPKESRLFQPHDLLVRSILTDEELAADFLRNYLDPKLAMLLDLKHLKCESPVAVDSNLKETLSDLRYSTFFKGTKRQLRVFVFVEHQSKPDRLMSLRLLDYVCRAYWQHMKKDKQGTLPYPLAVVLHHGKRPWNHVLSMRDLVDTVPGVDVDILRIPLCLVDLATIPPEQLRGNAMIRALLDCLQSASRGSLSERIEGITADLTDFKGDFRLKSWLTALLKYTMTQCSPQNGIEVINRIFHRFYQKAEADQMALTFAEEMERKGEAKGKVEGKAESVHMVLSTRFGSIPASLEKKLVSLRDPSQLDKALILAASCQSLAEFKKQFK